MNSSWSKARVAHFLLALGAAFTADGCAPREDPRQAAEPAAIATAMCREHKSDASVCAQFVPPPLASVTAYRECLDYNRRDLRPCAELRAAYEADLRAYLEAAPKAGLAAAPQLAAAAPITPPRLAELRRTAADLYRASSRDAQTFEAALLIPEVRDKVQSVLGQTLTDAALQALITKTRAEALYWYKYMQGLERLEASSGR